MAIRREDVERIAELARLRIPEERIEGIAGELSGILDFVAQLDGLDLGGLGPSTFASPDAPLREDRPDGRRLASGEGLSGAPEREEGFFLTPPIVENVNP